MYYVYILTNKHKRVLYAGVTQDLRKRLAEHRDKNHGLLHFTARYNCYYLVYFETYQDVKQAIAREKVIKGWTRAKKMVLIQSLNPDITFLDDFDANA